MDEKGALGLIIGIVVAVFVVGGTITYFLLFGGSSECIKICKDDGFNSGKEKSNQCNQGETAVDKCCCSNIIGGGSGGSGSGGLSDGTGSGGTSGSGSGGGTGTGGSGEISSWCVSGSKVARDFVSLQGVEIIKDQVNGIKTYKGKSACFFEIDFKTTKAIIENDIYVYRPGDASVITLGVEYHWVDGVCTEAFYQGASIPCPPAGVG